MKTVHTDITGLSKSLVDCFCEKPSLSEVFKYILSPHWYLIHLTFIKVWAEVSEEWSRKISPTSSPGLGSTGVKVWSPFFFFFCFNLVILVNWPTKILVWRCWCLLNYNKGSECETVLIKDAYHLLQVSFVARSTDSHGFILKHFSSLSNLHSYFHSLYTNRNMHTCCSSFL